MKLQRIAKKLKPKWERFKKEWDGCSLCSLSTHRQSTVLFRGNLPCNILLVGEAPGTSEDSIGYPFIGPAGNLLDEWIDKAKLKIAMNDPNPSPIKTKSSTSPHHQFWPALAITNIVCCIPKQIIKTNTGKYSQLRQPTHEESLSCRPRLSQFILLADPQAIITVGQISTKYLPKGIPSYPLIHPAAILRKDHQHQELANKKAILELVQIFQTVRDKK